MWTGSARRVVLLPCFVLVSVCHDPGKGYVLLAFGCHQLHKDTAREEDAGN